MTYSAAIDIGTHSALLLIAQCTDDQVVPQLDMALTTKLGAGLTSTGELSAQGIERLLAVLTRYRAMLSEYPIDHLVVFGTAAFRQARNATLCTAVIREMFGWPVRILSGNEEAEYAFRGICQLLKQTSPAAASNSGSQPSPDSTVLAIDIGGGSTEVIVGNPEAIQSQRSFPIGVVGLKQQLKLGDQLTAEDLAGIETFLTREIGPLSLPADLSQVIITGGTATTVAALLLEMTDYDFRRIDGYRCTINDIDLLRRELNGLTLSQRADLPGMEPGRADVILPALSLLLYLVGSLPVETITISIRGARYGILNP